MDRLWPRLKPHLNYTGPVVIAYSGGTDSSVLLGGLARARDKGQKLTIIAVTVDSPLHHPGELARAARLTTRLGIDHRILTEDPFGDPDFVENPKERCYLCKSRRFTLIAEMAEELSATAIMDGTNGSDHDGYRPGLKALAEIGIVSPLAEAGLSKAEVIDLGRELGLDEWLTPASACLATRLPYGTRLTPELVDMVARAERLAADLLGLELGSFRVRVHGEVARLEIPPERFRLVLERGPAQELAARLRGLGFNYIALDLEGYRSGSLDENLDQD